MAGLMGTLKQTKDRKAKWERLKVLKRGGVSETVYVHDNSCHTVGKQVKWGKSILLIETGEGRNLKRETGEMEGGRVSQTEKSESE